MTIWPAPPPPSDAVLAAARAAVAPLAVPAWATDLCVTAVAVQLAEQDGRVIVRDAAGNARFGRYGVPLTAADAARELDLESRFRKGRP